MSPWYWDPLVLKVVNYEIMNIITPHIHCEIDAAFLYDGDQTRSRAVPAIIIGAVTYLDQPILFHFMVEGRYLYSDLPITAVWGNRFTLQQASAVLCKTLELECFRFEGFKNVSVMIPVGENQEFREGEYLMSFDFPTGNESVHLVRLNQGGMVLAPNYRVNWKGERELADYLKNRRVWGW